MKFTVLAWAIFISACFTTHAQSVFEVRYTFPTAAPNPYHPATRLVEGSNGDFYGTTGRGGTKDSGTLFKFNFFFNTMTVLTNFNGTNGSRPFGGMVRGNDGNFYGATTDGGVFQNGTIFRFTPSGSLTSLFSFDGTNGRSPCAPLERATDGSFFGMTAGGGANGFGAVFRFTTNGGLTTLGSFNGTNGNNPSGSIALGNDGNLYGTTRYGGSNFAGPFTGKGVVFRASPTGGITRLIAFDGTNGSYPSGGLVVGDNAGELYGTTSGGGIYNRGTIFKITTNGALTTLVHFDGTNGGSPLGALVRAKNGNFYGTTAFRLPLSPDYGTLFRLTPQGELSTIVYMNGTNGAHPFTDFLPASDGYLYVALADANLNLSVNGGTIARLAEPPTITSVVRSNGTAMLTWNSLKNKFYGVQYKSALSNQWFSSGVSVIATGDTALATIQLPGAGEAYYRITQGP